MAEPDRPDPAPMAASPDSDAPGVVSSGWLAQHSVFEHDDERRIGRAMLSSIALHGVMAAAILALLSIRPESRPLSVARPDTSRLVFLEALPGRGGGGAGNPTPAPRRPPTIPKHEAPAPVPVVPPPDPVPQPPLPTLEASIVTSMADVIQASGTSVISAAQLGGGGRGRGLGPGQGDGAGPGTGGNFGDGIRGLGTGTMDPVLIHRVDPAYTNEAMRSRIQGLVVLEAVILANGTVGQLRVVRSLDAGMGLDQEALKAAKNWVFRPARDRAGNAVPVRVTLELEFTLR
jgi:periplasmic protein TonB